MDGKADFKPASMAVMGMMTSGVIISSRHPEVTFVRAIYIIDADDEGPGWAGAGIGV